MTSLLSGLTSEVDTDGQVEIMVSSTYGLTEAKILHSLDKGISALQSADMTEDIYTIGSGRVGLRFAQCFGQIRRKIVEAKDGCKYGP